MFQATLFDFNGVLVDDERVHLAAFQEVLNPRGIELNEAAYWSDYLGLDDIGVFRSVFEAHGETLNLSQIQELVQAKHARYLGKAEKELRGFDGASDLVRAAAELGPVIVVSGALRAEIELGLRWLGIRDAVAAVVSAEDTTHGKPEPEGYHLAVGRLQTMGVPTAREVAFVVEDSLEGIRAACAAGLTCVAVAHSYPIEVLQKTQAVAVVARIGEIDLPFLRELWNRR